jgi:hypothetical protein
MSSFRMRSIFENENHNGIPYNNMQHHAPLSSVRPGEDHRATRQRESPNGGRRPIRRLHILCFLFALAAIVRNEENRRLSTSDEIDLEARSLPVSVGRNDSTGGNNSISGNFSDSIDGGVDELIWRFRVPPTGGFYDMPMFKLCEWYQRGVHPRHEGSTTSKNGSVVESNVALHHVSLPPSGTLRLSLEIPSMAIATQHDSGTGNWIQQHYMIRMVAMRAARLHAKNSKRTRLNLEVSCADMQNPEVPKTLVLPWLTGNYSGTDDLKKLQDYWSRTKFNTFKKLNKKACGLQAGWYDAPILFLLPFIRDDFRRMAVGLVGAPASDPDHPAHAYMLSRKDDYGDSFQPLLSDIEIDDAAIHFRCGDIMLSENWFMFHFLKFRFFANRIPVNSTKSIGIVTQPFHNQSTTQKRPLDAKNEFASNLCMDVVLSFQQYLQHRFPSARVSIRNGPGETIALSLARLVMARYAYAAPDSTFSVFPVLATFGIGVQVNALHGGMLRGFTRDKEILETEGNIFFAISDASEVMSAKTTFQVTQENATRGREQILEWFRNDHYVIE